MHKLVSILLALVFTMYLSPALSTPLTGEAKVVDPVDNLVGLLNITGDLDRTANTMSVDPFSFFGMNFYTSEIELLGEGTHTRTDPLSGISDTVTVAPGQLGAWMTFDWGVSRFPTFMVWDVSTHADGEVYTIVDSDGDGIPGHAFFSGPFPGFTLAYEFLVGELPPGIEVTIIPEGGTTQECAKTGGSPVTLTAEIELVGGAEFSSLEWFLDGATAGTNPSITPFLGLGAHAVEVLATTTTGESDTDSIDIDVVDTTRPDLDIAFIDSQTGEPITSITGTRTNFVTISINASDICDPAPVSEGAAVPVYAVTDGDTIRIQGNTNTVNLPTSAIGLSAAARDASGNRSTAQSILHIE